jgi:putative nucleotidyltransferase with HDIG domain
MMETFKQFIVKHFEKVLIIIILIAAFVGTYLVEEKSIVLNFYYLPVVSAGYFLGRRMGVLTAIFSILVMVISTLLFPEIFFRGQDFTNTLAQLFSWGGFLILVSAAVGTLYEQNEQRLRDLKNAYIGVLEILSKYLESTDRYTKGHSVRVSGMAMEIAIAMGLPRAEVENIRVAGLLHDIGKTEVSADILRKAAELSPEERELMGEHTIKGAYLLSSVGSVLREVVPIVVSHHKYFMSGTEDRGNEMINIPLGARVIAVADAFDAMTTDRPYRKGMPPWQALDEIIKNSGKQFDPVVVEASKRVIGGKLEIT